MNWDAIGVIAEVIAAAAVVATLAYLSVQMRLAREASQVQSTLSIIEIFAHWRAHLIQNPGLAGLVAKTNRGEDLSDEEYIQVSTLMDDLLINTALAHAGSVKSNALYETSANIEYLMVIFDQNPGLARHWIRYRGFLEIASPDYVRAVDSRLKEKERGAVMSPNQSNMGTSRK
jgi:hypothetical protein